MAGLMAQDPARLDLIRREFERGFRALSHVDKGVSIFGSARTPRDHPDYQDARLVARDLGQGHPVLAQPLALDKADHHERRDRDRQEAVDQKQRRRREQNGEQADEQDAACAPARSLGAARGRDPSRETCGPRPHRRARTGART